jgi:hypothetical protein
MDMDDLARIASEIATVARVLDLEAEPRETVGLAYPPRAACVCYDAADLAGLAPADGGDLPRIAGHAERLHGIPRTVALVALDGETRHLQRARHRRRWLNAARAVDRRSHPGRDELLEFRFSTDAARS